MIEINRYSNGALHVSFGGITISVNTAVSCALPEGQFVVKNWSENQDIALLAEASGQFIVTGKVTQTGYVTDAPIWEILVDTKAWEEFQAREELRSVS